MKRKDSKTKKEERRHRDVQKYKEGFNDAWQLAKKVYAPGATNAANPGNNR